MKDVSFKRLSEGFKNGCRMLDALLDGDLIEFGRLLSVGHDPNLIIPEYGIATIHAAAGVGDDESASRAVTLCLEAGGDPNLPSGDGECVTPLHVASVWGHMHTVKCLLASGGDPGRPDSDGITPIDYAVREGRDEVVKALLRYNAAGAKSKTARSKSNQSYYAASTQSDEPRLPRDLVLNPDSLSLLLSHRKGQDIFEECPLRDPDSIKISTTNHRRRKHSHNHLRSRASKRQRMKAQTLHTKGTSLPQDSPPTEGTNLPNVTTIPQSNRVNIISTEDYTISRDSSSSINDIRDTLNENEHDLNSNRASTKQDDIVKYNSHHGSFNSVFDHKRYRFDHERHYPPEVKKAISEICQEIINLKRKMCKKNSEKGDFDEPSGGFKRINPIECGNGREDNKLFISNESLHYRGYTKFHLSDLENRIAEAVIEKWMKRKSERVTEENLIHPSGDLIEMHDRCQPVAKEKDSLRSGPEESNYPVQIITEAEEFVYDPTADQIDSYYLFGRGDYLSELKANQSGKQEVFIGSGEKFTHQKPRHDVIRSEEFQCRNATYKMTTNVDFDIGHLTKKLNRVQNTAGSNRIKMVDAFTSPIRQNSMHKNMATSIDDLTPVTKVDKATSTISEDEHGCSDCSLRRCSDAIHTRATLKKSQKIVKCVISPVLKTSDATEISANKDITTSPSEFNSALNKTRSSISLEIDNGDYIVTSTTTLTGNRIENTVISSILQCATSENTDKATTKKEVSNEENNRSCTRSIFDYTSYGNTIENDSNNNKVHIMKDITQTKVDHHDTDNEKRLPEMNSFKENNISPEISDFLSPVFTNSLTKQILNQEAMPSNISDRNEKDGLLPIIFDVPEELLKPAVVSKLSVDQYFNDSSNNMDLEECHTKFIECERAHSTNTIKEDQIIIHNRDKSGTYYDASSCKSEVVSIKSALSNVFEKNKNRISQLGSIRTERSKLEIPFDSNMENSMDNYINEIPADIVDDTRSLYDRGFKF